MMKYYQHYAKTFYSLEDVQRFKIKESSEINKYVVFVSDGIFFKDAIKQNNKWKPRTIRIT